MIQITDVEVVSCSGGRKAIIRLRMLDSFSEAM